MPQYYVYKSILAQLNAARVRQADRNLGNILPLCTSNSSLTGRQLAREKAEGMPIPSSGPLLEGRQLITSATAGYIPALKVPPSYIPVTADRGQGEGIRAWAPSAHVHEQTDVVLRFGLHKNVAQKQSKGSDSLSPTGLGANSCSKLHSWAWGQAKSRRGFTTSHGSTGRTIFQSLLPSGHTERHFSAPTSTLSHGEVANNSPHFCRDSWPRPQANSASGGTSWHSAQGQVCFPPRWLGDLHLPPHLHSYWIPKQTRLEELDSIRTCWRHVRRDSCK